MLAKKSWNAWWNRTPSIAFSASLATVIAFMACKFWVSHQPFAESWKRPHCGKDMRPVLEVTHAATW